MRQVTTVWMLLAVMGVLTITDADARSHRRRTPTPTPTVMPTPVPPTPVPTATATPTVRPTATPTVVPTATATATATPVPPSGTLIGPSDLVYRGSFLVPPGNWQDPPCLKQAFSLAAIAYRASDDSLFVNSHDQDPMCVGHFGPVPSDLSGTATIPVLEAFWGRVPRDPLYDLASKMKLHGLQWDAAHDRLCATETIWYNVSNSESLDAACIHADGTVDGPWELGFNNQIAGPIAQEANGKFFIGLTGVPGAASANFGPNVYETDFSGSAPVLPLMSHRYNPPNVDTREEMSNGQPWLTSQPAFGAAIVDGTLIWSVNEGENLFYGPGCTANPPLGNSFQEKYGFAPRSCSKGYHHDHYHPTLYLYSLADLEAVRAGAKVPTDVHPYGYLPLEPQVALQANIRELDFDPITRRLFLAESLGGQGVRIHVYVVAQ